MARFPYYKKNVKELGKLIARAALDENFRKALQENPSMELAGVGLPQQTTELIEFKVVDGKENPNAVALPFRLNQNKINSANEAYLFEISKMFSLN
ncbi:hypothetical protein [Roseibium marinum]|uniref:Uncharacterized protein n=1 Tax=Roseibium marinum TaxID=281252 RepID=A0A2S3UNK2_9HYPH|nr:hypothetical protein [Roseibium marinum]POF29285.1 hypothetical protein CLV41_10958 [Roseibium marinum]